MKRRKPPCPAAPPPHKEWGVKNTQLHRPWLAREKFMPPNSGAVGTLLSSTVKGTNAQRRRRTVLESFASSTLLSSFDDQEDDSVFLGRGWHLGIKVTVESRQVFRLPAHCKEKECEADHETWTRRQERNQVCFILASKTDFFPFFFFSFHFQSMKLLLFICFVFGFYDTVLL